MDDQFDIGRALRSYRIGARVNQEALARSLGVSQSQVSRWESGRDKPRAHNIEAIRALIWGRGRPQLASLALFVKSASAELALFDHDHRLLAASRSLADPDGPFSRMGWVFDPGANPGFAPIYAQYRRILAKPEGTVGLDIRLPFDVDGESWLGRARKTIAVIDGLGACLAEIEFRSDPERRCTAPVLKRIRPDPSMVRRAGSVHDQSGRLTG